MKTPLILMVLNLSLAFNTLNGQSKLTEHCLGLDHPDSAAVASIEDFVWLAGRWEGTGFGGDVEETWNPPLGGTMTGTFRLVNADGPSFYEMLLLGPDSTGHMSYRVKHFHPDFKGWEEKNECYTFPFIKATHDALYFHGLTLHRVGDTCFHYLAMARNDGSHKEVILKYVRRNSPVSPELNALLNGMPEVSRVPLLMLGSYHMGNPGADMFNLQADDVLAPKRQTEIQAVVDRLAVWAPTKVAIEAPFGDSLTKARYHAYLRGAYVLRKSEEEQIGFRLAKQLGHTEIYPIDVHMGMDDSALGEVIASNPQKWGPHMQSLETLGKMAIGQMDTWLKESTIGAMLFKMNDRDLNRVSHEIYFRYFAPVVDGDNFAGVDMINGWYHRNLRIFANLHQISETNDRILIVYGQGHIPLLQQFAEDSPYFSVDNVQEYLRGL